MIKLINNVNTIMAGLVSVEEEYSYEKIKLKNNFIINVYGNIKTASKIMVSLHGVGGDKKSNYNINFCNSFMNEFKEESCFITFDMPGVGDNIGSKYFWGASSDSIDVNLDEVISYIHDNNTKCKIFITAVSGSCYHLIAYFTDCENHIKNKFKDRINYTYLVSPLVDFNESLDWAKENSPFISYISFYEFVDISYKNKNIMEIKEIVDIFVHENVVEVHFRMVNDEEDTIRVDEFEFDIFDEYGYPVLSEDQTILEYDDENDSFDLDFLDVEVNESELVSFMNEYYMITNDIPNSEFF